MCCDGISKIRRKRKRRGSNGASHESTGEQASKKVRHDPPPFSQTLGGHSSSIHQEESVKGTKFLGGSNLLEKKNVKKKERTDELLTA